MKVSTLLCKCKMDEMRTSETLEKPHAGARACLLAGWIVDIAVVDWVVVDTVWVSRCWRCWRRWCRRSIRLAVAVGGEPDVSTIESSVGGNNLARLVIPHALCTHEEGACTEEIIVVFVCLCVCMWTT